MIKLFKRYFLCKIPYREKRAQVLWKKAYKEMLLARKRKWEHRYNISASSIINKT